jgi:nucleoid-associated protein EbfC
MFGNIGELLKMKKQMTDVQKKIKKAEHEGASSDGLVKAVVNGEFNLVSISISDELASSGDKKKLEKAVHSAVNTAVDKGKDFAKEQMKALTGGMNLPGLSDLL